MDKTNQSEILKNKNFTKVKNEDITQNHNFNVKLKDFSPLSQISTATLLDELKVYCNINTFIIFSQETLKIFYIPLI